MACMNAPTLLSHAAAPGPVFDFVPSQRYPDPRVQVLDPSFAKYRIFSSTVEMLGMVYKCHYPTKSPETGRGAKKSPLHDRLAAHGRQHAGRLRQTDGPRIPPAPLPFSHA